MKPVALAVLIIFAFMASAKNKPCVRYLDSGGIKYCVVVK